MYIDPPPYTVKPPRCRMTSIGAELQAPLSTGQRDTLLMKCLELGVVTDVVVTCYSMFLSYGASPNPRIRKDEAASSFFVFFRGILDLM